MKHELRYDTWNEYLQISIARVFYLKIASQNALLFNEILFCLFFPSRNAFQLSLYGRKVTFVDSLKGKVSRLS